MFERTNQGRCGNGFRIGRSKLIHLGFHLLYNQLASIYDFVSWLVSLGRWREWQRAALPFIHGPRILEIAHGPGHMLLALEEAGYQVYGLDISSQMVRIASKRIARHQSKATVIHGRADGLPFKDDLFDSVLVTFPSDFIFVPDTLSAIWRVLGTSGSVVIVISAELLNNGPASVFIRWLYRVTGQSTGMTIADSQSSVMSEIGKMLEKTRFDYRVEKVFVDGSLVTILVLETPTNA